MKLPRKKKKIFVKIKRKLNRKSGTKLYFIYKQNVYFAFLNKNFYNVGYSNGVRFKHLYKNFYVFKNRSDFDNKPC